MRRAVHRTEAPLPAAAWPIARGVNGTSIDRFDFTGRERDQSGLMHYRARTYDPRTGRFLQPDPAGMPDGPNRFTYVANDPVNSRDPHGLKLEAKPEDALKMLDLFGEDNLRFNVLRNGRVVLEFMDEGAIDAAWERGDVFNNVSNGMLWIAIAADDEVFQYEDIAEVPPNERGSYVVGPDGNTWFVEQGVMDHVLDLHQQGAGGLEWLGASLWSVGYVRDQYTQASRALDRDPPGTPKPRPNATARNVLKRLARQRAGVLGRVLVDKLLAGRLAMGREGREAERARRSNRPRKSNPSSTNRQVNDRVGRLRVAGRFLLIADAGLTVYEIVESEDRYRATAQGGGRFAGALAGGEVGALIGAPILPPAGAIVGGITGRIVGGIVGGDLGEGAYDAVHGDPDDD